MRMAFHLDVAPDGPEVARLRESIQRDIDAHGAIDIQKDTGLFVCRR